MRQIFRRQHAPAVESDPPRRDDGLGLAELVVTMMVGTLVLTVLGTTFMAGSNATSGVSARTTNTQQERAALNALTKNLRTALAPAKSPVTTALSPATSLIVTPFCTAAPTEVSFYAFTNPAQYVPPNAAGVAQAPTPPSLPTLMRYSVGASGNLVEQQQPPSSSQDVAPCTTTTWAVSRVLARNVVTSSPIFTYRRVGGTAVGSTVAATDFGTLDSVAISLAIQTPSSPTVPATTVQTIVRLPNPSYK